MKISEIQDLIKFVARSGVTEVEIEQANFKITIKSEGSKKRSIRPEAEGYLPQPMQQQMPMQQQQLPMQQVQQQAPQQSAQTQAAAPAPEAPKAADANYVTIKSPMIGTFYRSAGPDKPPFVSVGDEIKLGKVICIVEAMKLFNEIEAEVSGKIVKVLVDDASPVEYDQPLFLVDPS